MDVGARWHGCSDAPADKTVVRLAQADGDCRTRGGRAWGPGASARALLAVQPGQRRGRLLQISARFWDAVVAPLAEVMVAAMATRALNVVAAVGSDRGPGFDRGNSHIDVDGMREQL